VRYQKAKLAVAILMLMLACSAVNGQGGNPLPSLEPISILPVSPNTASLGNYAEIPVSSHTGIPEIGIPLWQASIGDINLPISLSYHAGGIKVDEIASWVGLGWSLNAGGSIARSIRGKIDGPTFSYTKINKYADDLMTYSEKASYLDDLLHGRADSEPDMYYLNTNGISCQFYQASNGSYVTLPLDVGLKIERPMPSVWVVTDNKGMKYTFSEFEHTESADLEGKNHFQSVTAWYISSIEDTKGNKMEFFYYEEGYVYNNKAVEKVYVYDNSSASCGGIDFVGLFSMNSISAPVLQRIKYNNAEIVFNTKTVERQDLPGGRALDNIEIKYNNSLVKRFRLFTSYFTNTTIGTTNNRYHLYAAMDQYRLRLDSVREESAVSVLPPYKFDYIADIGLPYRLSNAQDDWGYYNGANNSDFVSYVQNSIPKGADKKVNPQFSNQFTLNKITYPTGGYRTYEYESNKLPGNGQPVFVYKPFIVFEGGNAYHRPEDDKEIFIETMDVDLAQYVTGNQIIFNVQYTIEDEPNSDCSFEFFLLKDGEAPITLLPNQTYLIPAETYTLMGKISQPTDGPGERYPVSYHLTLSGDVIDPSLPTDAIEAPGIRIKKITNNDGSHVTNTKVFDYSDPSTGKSSGYVGNTPSYRVDLKKDVLNNNAERSGVVIPCSFTEYSSQSNYPLINTRSSHVGYSFVTEYNDDNGVLGKKVSKYTNFDSHSDINGSSEFPFQPFSSQSWKRGLPLTESVYERIGGSYILKQEKIFNYQVLQNSNFLDRGIKVGALWRHDYMDLTLVAPPLDDYKGDVYGISTDAFKLISDSLIVYDNPGFLQTKNTYSYADTYFQLNKVASLTSKGEPVMKEVKYPFDMVSSGSDPSGIYQNMVAKNMVLYPAEQKETNNTITISKAKIDYVSTSAGQYVPGSYKTWNRNTNLDETDLIYNVFDAHGKPLQATKSNGITTTYLWGYNHQYLVAEIVGAQFATVNLVIDTSLINSQAMTEAQIRSELNKLRTDNRTKGALTKTYTYKPLIGMTSETDANGRTQYYEYDAFNRLSLIRDEKGNILKKYCYNYYNQVTDCGYVDIAPLWQATNITRCQPCAANSAYTSGVQEHQEQDNNPNSLSHGDTRWVSDGTSSSCTPTPNWQNTATALRCRVVNGQNTSELEQEQADMNPCSGQGTRWVVISTNCTTCPKPQAWVGTNNYRCITANGINTGGQEREEVNTEACSPGANTTRWVSVGTNCVSCPKPQVWQATGNYRCVVDGSNNNTGAQEREERNNESCSMGYNDTRWVSNGTNCASCPKPQNWQPTGFYPCVTSGGANTGEQQREERNIESCSPGYNDTRIVSNGQNTTACPIPPPPATVYARLGYENEYYMPDYGYADVVVRFYSDASGTIPIAPFLQVDYGVGESCNNYSIVDYGTISSDAFATVVLGWAPVYSYSYGEQPEPPPCEWWQECEAEVINQQYCSWSYWLVNSAAYNIIW
jgi:YD repeat-containing protein